LPYIRVRWRRRVAMDMNAQLPECTIAPRPCPASPVVAEHGLHHHIVLAPAALPFVPEVRMSGRRRGETGWRNVVAYARGHALAQRSVTAALDDDAGRWLPRLLSALPFLLEVRDDKWLCAASVRAQIPHSASACCPSHCRARPPAFPETSSSPIPHPLPVVTAGSNAQKAEVGECRNAEHNLRALRCTRDMRCTCVSSAAPVALLPHGSATPCWDPDRGCN
jgi:hypothetical protein